MKKALLFFLVIIAIIVQLNNNTINAKAIDCNSEEQVLIESLLKARLEVWNKVYDPSVDKPNWVEELKKYVTNPLLEYDVNAFIQLTKNPTDMDKVNHVKIKEIKKIDRKEDAIRAIVCAIWTIEGKKGTYMENIEYEILLKKENSQWKISDYKINE
ncbi:MAG: hypothetical protein N4A57_17005 [Anaeromicrobium sp.]|jgi:hypothetical protein|uniref:hypothetical protein n=1 Tax=Anaeromicrobium sp. TaxID=1929132 RepID=UPI0025F42C9A|nr:hypothetical protein [Anaeromicrobium sp.]MCT4595947.1 hypothetical protein [Anaeromicrobium sp.]